MPSPRPRSTMMFRDYNGHFSETACFSATPFFGAKRSTDEPTEPSLELLRSFVRVYVKVQTMVPARTASGRAHRPELNASLKPGRLWNVLSTACFGFQNLSRSHFA